MRPSIKEKWRPGEARPHVEKVITEKLKDIEFYDAEESKLWAKDIGRDVKDEMKNMEKDVNYKYCVNVVIGEKKGQGVQASMFCHWDQDCDNCVNVSVVDEIMFVFVTVFAVYHYPEK